MESFWSGSSLPSVVVVGASGESPLKENNVSPSWHKIVESARSSLSYVESVQDVGVTPRKILGRGLELSVVKKIAINWITCSPVFLSICSSILPPSWNSEKIEVSIVPVQNVQNDEHVQDVQNTCLTCSHSLVIVASPAETWALARSWAVAPSSSW